MPYRTEKKAGKKFHMTFGCYGAIFPYSYHKMSAGTDGLGSLAPCSFCCRGADSAGAGIGGISPVATSDVNQVLVPFASPAATPSREDFESLLDYLEKRRPKQLSLLMEELELEDMSGEDARKKMLDRLELDFWEGQSGQFAVRRFTSDDLVRAMEVCATGRHVGDLTGILPNTDDMRKELSAMGKQDLLEALRLCSKILETGREAAIRRQIEEDQRLAMNPLSPERVALLLAERAAWASKQRMTRPATTGKAGYCNGKTASDFSSGKHGRGNVGEWSELYATLDLLGRGEISIDGESRQVAYVRHVASDGTVLAYEHVGSDVVVSCESADGSREPLMRVPASEFSDMSRQLVDFLRNPEAYGLVRGSARSFPVPIGIWEFAERIGLENFKADSLHKADVTLGLRSHDGNGTDELGFSVKSYIGQRPTLLNASSGTASLFEITGISEEERAAFNARASQRGKFEEALRSLMADSSEVCYLGTRNPNFQKNMRGLYSRDDGRAPLPEIMGQMCLFAYSGESDSSLPGIVARMQEQNPLGIEPWEYEVAVKSLLWASYAGMTPSRIWDSGSTVGGGLLSVGQDGTIQAYSEKNRETLVQQLYEQSYIEKPSKTKNDWGYVNESNVFVANAQIRMR